MSLTKLIAGLEWLAHLRCPDHGRYCDGRHCCCREWHWKPIRYRRFMKGIA